MILTFNLRNLVARLFSKLGLYIPWAIRLRDRDSGKLGPRTRPALEVLEGRLMPTVPPTGVIVDYIASINLLTVDASSSILVTIPDATHRNVEDIAEDHERVQDRAEG